MTYKKDVFCEGCQGCGRCRVHPTLASLGVGECAVVRKILENGRNIAERLCDLGFSCGCHVQCVGRSPMGGMSAYSVRGAVIALRDEDAETVVTAKYGQNGNDDI